MSAIQDFSTLSQSRNQVYDMLDNMADDSVVSSVLEIYAEDCTEYNEEGDIVWVQSNNPEITQYIAYLLDTLNVDKHIYKWAYNLCKYGDIYLRLYRQSEYNNALLELKDDKDVLNEDIKINAFKDSDKFVHYIEQHPNPAEVFELTRFGKTEGYIQADIRVQSPQMSSINAMQGTSLYRYKFKRDDINIFDARTFVHACLEDNSSRTPEEVELFRTDITDINDVPLKYTVRRGQSLLYNVFKIWRELMLLENSVLLNRITKSSIVRMINVEVGDMPKDKVDSVLKRVKQLIEQKSAIKAGESLAEYTNPGPMENNLYIPTHGGIGAISTTQVGGDVDVKGLADLDYFKTKLYSALRVPKQYLNDTDDSTGFNGGTSLSLISSRYAKMIKRLQHTLTQMITDVINIMLIDKGLKNYINKFTICMLPPTTQEELDRRDNKRENVGIAQDIMNIVDAIENPIAKLQILKALLSNVVTDNDIIQVIQDEIDTLEKSQKSNNNVAVDGEGDINTLNDSDSFNFGADLENTEPLTTSGSSMSVPSEGTSELEEPTEEENPEETVLPTPDSLGVDMTQNQ